MPVGGLYYNYGPERVQYCKASMPDPSVTMTYDFVLTQSSTDPQQFRLTNFNQNTSRPSSARGNHLSRSKLLITHLLNKWIVARFEPRLHRRNVNVIITWPRARSHHSYYFTNCTKLFNCTIALLANYYVTNLAAIFNKIQDKFKCEGKWNELWVTHTMLLCRRLVYISVCVLHAFIYNPFCC